MAVSSIPILVNSVKVDGTEFAFYGPYAVGSDLYIAIYEITGLSDLEVTVFKSVDSGATWIAQDSAVTSNGGLYMPIFQPTTIHFIYARNGAPNVLGNVRFNIATDSFVPAVEVTVVHDLVVLGAAVERSDGSIVAVYVTDDTSIEALQFNVFSPGAWGTEALVFQAVAGEVVRVLGALVDVADTMHLIWNDEISAVDTPRYQTIDFGGSVSVDVVIPISDFGTAPKSAVLWSGVLVFAYIDTATNLGMAAFATGATTNPATASWTTAALWSGTLAPGSIDSYPFPIIATGPLLQVFFVNTDISGAPADIYMVQWNGSTFNSPVLFYDSAAFPPPGAIGDVSERILSLPPSNGSQYLMAFAASSSGTGSLGTFYVTSGGVGPTSGYRNRVY